MATKTKINTKEEANYLRGAGWRGKKRPEHSEWLSKNHPLRGKHHSSIAKINIAAGVKKAVAEGRVKTDNFKGHRHSTESKLKMAEASRAMWADPNSILNSPAHRQRIGDRVSKLQQSRPWLNRYSRGNGSHYMIGGKEYWFRSSWEVVYARYLQFLLNKKEIALWEYEVDTFWFEKIRRGIRSYKPDFKITNLDASIEYHEVKGWMDKKSATKLKRMAKYYPEIKMVLIDKDVYKSIKKWERLFPES